MSEAFSAKIMIGHKLRKLRKELGISQALMAKELGVSPPYINLLENNMRPITVQFLFKLGQTYDIDLKEIAEDDSSKLTARLIEIFADPILGDQSLTRRDIQQLAQSQPTVANAILTLYESYETMKSAAQKVQMGWRHALYPDPLKKLDNFWKSQKIIFLNLKVLINRFWI